MSRYNRLMLKAVIFDVDGVLLDSKEANMIFFSDLLVGCGYKKPTKKQLERVFHLTMWDAIKFLTGLTSDEAIKRIWERGITGEYSIDLVKLPKGAKGAIRRLAKTYKLAIVTGRIAEGIQEFYDLSGLKNLFDVAVGFEDYKNPKPHPEPILVALERLKVKPEESVYVGDSATDFEAAKKAKVKFIFYSQTSHSEAEFNANSFKQIESIISKIAY